MSVGLSHSLQELIRYAAEQAAGVGRGELTDWNPLSVTRTLTEGFAVIAERQGENLIAGLAEGVDRATYRSFGFPRKPAERASGVVAISRAVTTAALTVPAGTRVGVANSEKVYLTLDTLTLGVGVASGTTRIQALVPGAFGNTSANTVTRLIGASGGATVTNAAPIAGGVDEETDEARRLRFDDYVRSIHRGTPDAIEQGARTAALYDGGGLVTEQVRSAQVTDSYATARCYIWNGATSGSPASSDLIARAQEIIDGYTDGVTGALVAGYKPAGVAVEVVAATVQPQTVAIVLFLAEGWTFNMVSAGVGMALRGVFDRLKVGSPLLRLNDLRRAVGDVPGVVDLTFLAPTADVAGGNGVIVTLGAITLYQGS